VVKDKKQLTEIAAGAAAAHEARPGGAEEARPAADPPAAVEEGPDSEALAREVEEWRSKAAGYQNDVLRLRAEMDNLRKRTERDVENAHKYGQERLILEMLPVKDSMELGLATAPASDEPAGLRAGMELTLKLFNTALEKLNVAEVCPLGEKFNPELHQAISMQESSAEPGTVLTVVQKGYTLNGRLLRPAMVIVARARAEAG